MCTNPLFLPRNSKEGRRFHLENVYRSIGKPFYDWIQVPCGKCIDCLKKRQNDLAVRVAREAAARGSMHFLTLTYNEDTLPLQCTLVQVDKETGEVSYPLPSSPLVRISGRIDSRDADNAEFVSVARGILKDMPRTPKARVIERPWFEDDSFQWSFLVTPSLYRRDVRLWLKRCRVRYKRQFGGSLPDFSYVVCGEMGPNTARPHYHCAFFGLQDKHVQFMAAQWDFGFWNLKKVNAVNPDGTNGFQIAANYIGKYMSKGKFECDSVKCGFAQKPRLMLSRFLGVELPVELVSYYRCYDLYGEFDINSLINPRTGAKYTLAELKDMASEIRKRACIEISGRRYALPRALKIKLWYNYNEITKTFQSSDLRVALSAALFRDDIADVIAELRANRGNVSFREISAAVSEFLALQERSFEDSERRGSCALQSFYAQSIF